MLGREGGQEVEGGGGGWGGYFSYFKKRMQMLIQCILWG